MKARDSEISDQLQQALEARVTNVRTSIEMAEKALEMALITDDALGVAWAENYLGLFHMITGNNPTAIHLAGEALRYFKSEDLPEGAAFALYTMGSVEYKTANHEKGLELLIQCLNLYRQIGDQANESKTLKAIGYIYEVFSDYDNAFQTYLKCREISRAIGDKNGESNACNPLSGLYLNRGDIDSANEAIETSIRLKEESGDVRGLAFAYYGKAKVLHRLQQYREAEEFYRKSLEIHTNMEEHLGEGMCFTKLAALDIDREAWESAKKHASTALNIGLRIDNNDIVYKAYYHLYTIAKAEGVTENALIYHENYQQVREEVLSIEASGKIKAQSTLHRLEMLEKEAEMERQKNIELKKANDIIAAKNKHITDSISYSKRIQDALMPDQSLLDRLLEDHFVLYRPKDIVSGDFYWAEEVDGIVYYAVADCTGHGVPGAFVSVVCHNALNRVVKEFKLSQAAAILDKVRDLVIETFRTGTDDDPNKAQIVRDGMDIALCCFNPADQRLNYAGAFNSLYVITREADFEDRNPKLEYQLMEENGYALYEVRADKQPVSIYPFSRPFSDHQLQLKPGEMLYTFTDGFADQFGGEKGRKFMYKNFRKLLLSLQGDPLETQRELLIDQFKAWKGRFEQVDDICIIGKRI